MPKSTIKTLTDALFQFTQRNDADTLECIYLNIFQVALSISCQFIRTARIQLMKLFAKTL